MLGDLLRDRGEVIEVFAIGGGSLALTGLTTRPTLDLDLVAVVREGVFESATPLPANLEQAVADVADLLDLASDWLNPGPTDLLRFGLPSGYEERLGRNTMVASRSISRGDSTGSASSSTPRSIWGREAST